MNIDITPVVNAAVILIGAVITAFVVPWIQNKTSAARFSEISCWVSVAVEAAEQIYKGTGRGKEKKAYVLSFLESKGFTIDFDSLDNLIESAVFSLPETPSAVEQNTDMIGFTVDENFE